MEKTYFVYIDSHIVFKGCYSQTLKYLGVADTTLRKHIKEEKPIKANDTIYNIVVVDPKIKISKKEQEYRDIVWHLNEYGNTVVVHEPTELVKRLKKESHIIVDVQHYKAKYLLEETYKEDWILTVRKWEIMEKIDAFKNELKNYHYYKNVLNDYIQAYEENDKSILEAQWPRLKEIALELEATYVRMTGVSAIKYDKLPSSFNPELSQQLKLELIEKYNYLLKEYAKEKKTARSYLKLEIERLTANITKIEKILNQLPKEIQEWCLLLFCERTTYKALSKKVAYTDVGLIKKVNRELEKVL